MPRLPRKFINGEIYHIVLRRMGDQLLFKDINDYYRGIFYIYECNTTKTITIRECRRARARLKKVFQGTEADRNQNDRGLTPVKLVKPPEKIQDTRDLLVEVLAFCLMPNHIHLLVRQLKEGGISKFIQKIASGYAAYFKKKYNIRLKGHFFQDRFRAVHIKTEEQLKVVFVYIHTNPVALIEPEWKEKGIKNPDKVIKLLEEYKWSSYQDYLGKKNFPSVTEREFVLKIIGGKESCREWVENWINYKKEVRRMLKEHKPLLLE